MESELVEDQKPAQSSSAGLETLHSTDGAAAGGTDTLQFER